NGENLTAACASLLTTRYKLVKHPAALKLPPLSLANRSFWSAVCLDLYLVDPAFRVKLLFQRLFSTSPRLPNPALRCR
ncbi:hypothetical protein, partial [Azospirillum doebereinerae]|uniref:hypothetical protein n=1 Tax=Azospirillum doebereinerae TaxID=92933 RepID=UPI001B3BD416